MISSEGGMLGIPNLDGDELIEELDQYLSENEL